MMRVLVGTPVCLASDKMGVINRHQTNYFLEEFGF